MYFVTLVGRSYNIVIFPRAGAPGQQSAAFTSRLETCRGPIQEVDCDITIDFDWDAGGAGSGTGQVTIFSGSSSASTIPAPGNPLIYVGITNLTYTCPSYNSVLACPPYSNATTTTTSTTTTTTTISPSLEVPTPYIKFDQYSGSLSAGIWPNLGTAGAGYNLKVYNSPVVSGSGTSSFVAFVSNSFGTGSGYNVSNTPFTFTSVFYLPDAPLPPFYRRKTLIGQLEYTASSGQPILNQGAKLASLMYSSSVPTFNVTANSWLLTNQGNGGAGSITVNTGSWYVVTYVLKAETDGRLQRFLYSNKDPFYSVGAFYSTDPVPTMNNPVTFIGSEAGFYNSINQDGDVHIGASLFWTSSLTDAQIQKLHSLYTARFNP